MKGRVALLAALLLAIVQSRGQQNSASIDAPEGTRALLQAKGEGVQIYTCTDAPAGRKWVLKGPDAKLLDANGNVIGTHSIGPRWTLNDGSAVQGEMVASKPSFDPNSVAWLLLRTRPGTATGSLSTVTYIRRTDTHGGAANTAGCQDAADIGKTIQVPYTATYTFYVAK